MVRAGTQILSDELKHLLNWREKNRDVKFPFRQNYTPKCVCRDNPDNREGQPDSNLKDKYYSTKTKKATNVNLNFNQREPLHYRGP